MKYWWVLLLTIGLTACAPKRPATVDERGTKPHHSQTRSYNRHQKVNKQPKTHTIKKGESLYSIGFKYQMAYQTLAALNNIAPPYRIYPGQVLKLEGKPQLKVFQPSNTETASTKPLASNQPISSKPTPKPAQTQVVKPKNQTAGTQPKDTPSQTTPAKPKTTKPAQTTVAQPNATKPAPRPLQKPAVTPKKTNLNWLWPTKGKIRTTFLASNPARKGISISGKEGQDIKAAEAGVVVYSGNGLLGYGELVIIKHNDSFLSAYGHNKTLKVKEGQQVKRGQVIAELGSTGTNVNNLHFEIRKNGKPVNPLNYVKP